MTESVVSSCINWDIVQKLCLQNKLSSTLQSIWCVQERLTSVRNILCRSTANYCSTQTESLVEGAIVLHITKEIYLQTANKVILQFRGAKFDGEVRLQNVRRQLRFFTLNW